MISSPLDFGPVYFILMGPQLGEVCLYPRPVSDYHESSNGNAALTMKSRFLQPPVITAEPVIMIVLVLLGLYRVTYND